MWSRQLECARIAIERAARDPQSAGRGIVGGRGSSSVVPAGHAATHRSYGRLRDFYPHELTKPPKTHSIAGPTAEKGAWSMTPIAVPLELLLIFIYSAFLIPSIVPSTASLVSLANSLTFAAAFSAAPSFSTFLSPVNLPTPSSTAPLAWAILSSIDITITPFI